MHTHTRARAHTHTHTQNSCYVPSNHCYANCLCHRVPGNRSGSVISHHTYSSHQQNAVVKPKAGQNVNLLSSNSCAIGTGRVMEDNILHGYKIPDGFLKVTITKIDGNIPPLLKSTFDEPYLKVGGFTAWPAHQCIALWPYMHAISVFANCLNIMSILK